MVADRLKLSVIFMFVLALMRLIYFHKFLLEYFIFCFVQFKRLNLTVHGLMAWNRLHTVDANPMTICSDISQREILFLFC